MWLQAQSLVGLVAIPLIAWALSERRAAIKPARLVRILIAGIGLQVLIAGLMLNVPAARAAFDWADGLVAALQSATGSGTRLVFGYLAGGPAPYETVRPATSFILAFQALPLILVISALSKLLYHWGLLQRIVYAIGWVLQRSLGVTGPVGTSAAANVFVGMVEAPLLVRPYLSSMSRGGLFATMTVGMAGVAGTVLALYAAILEPLLPGAAGHLIVASVISVPAGLMLSELMVPDPAPLSPDVEPAADISVDDPPHSSMDAIAQGTREGIELLVNVTAMLVVMVALVALANQLMGLLTTPLGTKLTIEGVLGFLFAPLAWLLGIPWAECGKAGTLLGVKTVLNELIAYLQLAQIPGDALAGRSRLILTYALCGFANFGSLGIMIGGMVAMVPVRRAEIVSLGAKTIVSGTLATMMTAAVVGAMTP
ncbi:MAG TPA: nucleoside transporter C-terminal domain-containing protein, partial [Hyphomicrobiaceae bacterium]|nr:nucleoside transporter C-terminal domain-containing protein [Hyphomicrobiaceae bacterium]